MPSATGKRRETVLVTGAGGFVGRGLIRKLGRQAVVIGLYHTDTSPSEVLTGEYCVGDVTERESFSSLPATDVVIHLAAVTPNSRHANDPAQILRTNCEGTLNALEYAKSCGSRKFIFTSTGSVYESADQPIDEGHALAPRDIYGLSKLFAEQICEFHRSDFEQITILRLFHPYGPGQPDHHMIPRIVSRLRANQPINVPSRTGPRRTVTYVDDVIDVIAEIAIKAEIPGLNTFNVGSDQVASVVEIARTLAEALGVEHHTNVTDGPVEDLVADVNALTNVVGRRDWVSLDTGLGAVARLIDT